MPSSVANGMKLFLNIPGRGSDQYTPNPFAAAAVGRLGRGLNVTPAGRSSSSEEEGVRTELSRAGRRGISASGAETEKAIKSLVGSNQPNAVQGLLKELSEISKSLRTLNDQLTKAQPGSTQESSLRREEEALAKQYDSILSGKDFADLISISSQVRDVLKGGTRSQDLARALFSKSNLLGADYLARVFYGDTASLEQFQNGLKSLGSISASSLTSDLNALDKLDGIVKSVGEALQGPTSPSQTDAVATRTLVPSAVEPPRLAQLNYGSGTSGVSLALKTFTGTDAIQAALAHVPFDPKGVLQLVYNPHDELEKQKQQAHEDQRDVQRLDQLDLRSPSDDQEKKSGRIDGSTESSNAEQPRGEAIPG